MSILPNWNNEPEQWLAAQNVKAQKLLGNPLLRKDIWRTIEDLNLKVNQHAKVLTINFEHIEQDWLKLLAKLYILLRSRRKLSAAYLKQDVGNLTKFSIFISSKSIFSAKQINNQLFEEYDYYLHSLVSEKTKEPLSERSIATHYMTLVE